MTKADDLKGIEFDWFAADMNSQMAIFATAGNGFIPNTVFQAIDVHEAISEAIDNPNWGNESIWDDYASLGLYVFDWNGDTYQKIRSPQSGENAVLSLKIKRIELLPIFNFSFDDMAEIRAEET